MVIGKGPRDSISRLFRLALKGPQEGSGDTTAPLKVNSAEGGSPELGHPPPDFSCRAGSEVAQEQRGFPPFHLCPPPGLSRSRLH